MKTVTIKLPDNLDLDDKEASMLFAATLYERGRLSLGQAAELVGLTKKAFTDILGKYGVSIFNYPATDIHGDVKNA